MLDETGFWRDLSELPETLTTTLEASDGVREVAGLLSAGDARRIIASGNGAAYYVAVALWLASLEGRAGLEVQAVPSGLLAGGRFPWRDGDVLLAISSSGEFRDLVEAIEGAPSPYAAITATPGSTLGSRAGARALVTVLEQRAVTHTQAFCGAVLQALAVWAELTGDEVLRGAVRQAPEAVATALERARAWVDDLGTVEASTAVAFGSGPGWAAALEAALLLKEVSGIPAEGVETREGATSAMMALDSTSLALSLPVGGESDRLLDEAEAICAGQGATVLRAPVGDLHDRRLAAVTTFPAAATLSAHLGVGRGLDVDQPAWIDAYYRVARGTT